MVQSPRAFSLGNVRIPDGRGWTSIISGEQLQLPKNAEDVGLAQVLRRACLVVQLFERCRPWQILDEDRDAVPARTSPLLPRQKKGPSTGSLALIFRCIEADLSRRAKTFVCLSSSSAIHTFSTERGRRITHSRRVITIRIAFGAQVADTWRLWYHHPKEAVFEPDVALVSSTELHDPCPSGRACHAFRQTRRPPLRNHCSMGPGRPSGDKYRDCEDTIELAVCRIYLA